MYRNFVDGAALTGPVLAGYPLSNLQTRELSRVCRMPLAPNQSIVVDLGAVMRVDGVAALATNHAQDSRASSDLIVETGAAIGGPWVPSSIGLPNDTGLPDLPRHVIGRIRTSGGAAISTRYLRVTPNWTVQPGDAYRELGRLMLSRTLDLSNGPSQGWGFGVIDRGSLDESDGGQAYEDRRDRGRSLTVTCANLSVMEAYGFTTAAVAAGNVPSIQDMLMAVGATGELIAIHRADSPLWIRRTSIYGHLTPESLRLQHVAGDTYRWDATLIEEH